MIEALKVLWGLLFRLFPSPTRLGLRKIGSPGRSSPVLVTCNFALTVRRLERALRGRDLWLLVAESKGVNVWCAAGAGELSTRSVVAAVKTSGIGELVDHRTLVLPPLGAPGIRAVDVEAETGWTVRWGPVYMRDIPRFLEQGLERDEGMGRTAFGLGERLDAALGSHFSSYLLAAVGFAFFGPGLLLDFLVVAAASGALFMAVAPWVPGKGGMTKTLVVLLLLGAALAASELLLPGDSPRLRADLIIAMSAVAMCGFELGGLSSTMASDFDPFMARLGVKSIGNVSFAGTQRTDLLCGRRVLRHRAERCTACGHCFAVCPLEVWDQGPEGVAVLARPERCTACGACLRQCPSGAIRAPRVDSSAGETGDGRSSSL